MPLVSAILPCYNVEKLIDRCLQSIVDQTLGLNNIEIICVDDCSTDDTLSKLKEWEQKFPDNFLIVESPVNGRQGQARNIGLQYANAEWIAFIDSDDWVDPDYLQAMYEQTIADNYQIVCCGYERDFSKELTYFNDENASYTVVDIGDDESRKKEIMHPELGYSGWAKLFRKDFLIDNELFFPTNITYEDAAWGSLVHLYFNKACILQRKLYHYFVNDSSTVLTKNSNHHLDCLTAQTRLWHEYQRRGFLEAFREELEVEHIYSAYLPGIKMLILRYEEPDYNIYLLLRELILERIPDITHNKYYVSGEFSELYVLMLDALMNPLSKKQFLEFAGYIKQIGI